MNLLVLNEKFETTYLVDAYKSLIWTERYNSPGDFELYTEVSGESLENIFIGSYLVNPDSDRVMIVDDIEIIVDLELGTYIKFTGSSLEQILSRRIIWNTTQISGEIQNGIQTLINENIISPAIAERKIDNFIFTASTDEAITKLTAEKQYTGDALDEAIMELCILNKIGYKIILNSSNQFEFSLYAGVDRSYNQTDNPYVTFSPNFENLINSNYYQTDADYKNITLIAGQGQGEERIYTTYGSGTGLDRRELFTDARDLSPEDITEEQYLQNLQDRGKEKLDEYTALTTFEGSVEPYNSFVYKEDYNLGDIVQIENEYGKRATTRITEIITCHDESGYSLIPTFEMEEINDEETTEGGTE